MADSVAITAGAGTNIGTDTRTINAASVEVQRVVSEGGTALAVTHVTISSTAATLIAARDTRKSVIIINRQTVPVYIGIATVTVANGILMNPGDVLEMPNQALVQGITSAAYTAVGTDDQVMVVESYDS